MLPEWMKEEDDYHPEKDRNPFVLSTIKAIGSAMAKIRVQRGHEKGRTMPPVLKLCLLFAMILCISISQNRLFVMACAAIVLLYLCTWPARDILPIIKAGLKASLLAFLILLPAMITHPALIHNDLFIVSNVFLSIVCLSIFNHTTQWNHITMALKQIHLPSLFVFTLDMALKYIVLLGSLMRDLLTAVQVRSVGRNHKKYNSIGGVMGVTFVRGSEMNRQMYEAMQCRGFTDDYNGL
ncbi:MAG: energy-coupling factor transporter transmembrane component T [Lactimicrobium sp.]|jgi:cobalt/nickel transport system permease protein|uniref:energy-coupling factor transporter transmembrane component T n=1 Tax=Lactimicrobium sp. TaxID=2563780 RepID=UPI002F34FD40